MSAEQTQHIWAVVVAAGKGTRFGQPYNKVFHPLDGVSVLTRCLKALEAFGVFEGAVLVLSSQDEEAYQALIAREGESPLVRARCTGGASRQESVLSGLRLVPQNAGIVAIHDAARLCDAAHYLRNGRIGQPIRKRCARPAADRHSKAPGR